MANTLELVELTAAEAARRIRTGDVSPVELVQALLDRADAVEQRIQAWEVLDAERALTAARAAEEALRREPSSVGSLHGVPFGVKDIFDTAGLRTAAGFRPYDARVPAADAEAVVRLKQAGGILLGKMVTTQFAFTDPPRTRNPWSEHRTPGGSSSGPGAGVAAREAPVALGSQTAGSILRPAAYNGVVGLKPTYGRISTRGVLPLAWSMDHVGVLARSVDDCALLLEVLADPETPAAPAAEPSPPRLGLLRAALDRASPAVRAHVEAVARRFVAAGADVVEVELGVSLDLMLAVHYVTMATEASAVHWQLLEQFPGAHKPRLRALAEVGRLLPGTTYVHAQRLRVRIQDALASSLAGLQALLLPTVADLPPGPDSTGDPSLQAPFTLVGAPAISLPSGLSTDGLPFAIQLVGARRDESRLLAAARWCEQQLGPLPAPPL